MDSRRLDESNIAFNTSPFKSAVVIVGINALREKINMRKAKAFARAGGQKDILYRALDKYVIARLSIPRKYLPSRLFALLT